MIKLMMSFLYWVFLTILLYCVAYPLQFMVIALESVTNFILKRLK